MKEQNGREWIMVWRGKLGETYDREKDKSITRNHTARAANPRINKWIKRRP